MPGPTKTTRRTTTTRAAGSPTKVSRQRVLDRIQRRAASFVETKFEAAALAKHANDERDWLIDQVATYGELDEKGNSFLQLPSLLTAKDHNGKVFKYQFLKRERHLSPANPLPIPELTEALLKEKKLWIKPTHQKVLDEIQSAYPFLTIEVDVNIDAIASQGYFSGIISEDEYDSLLPVQVETFQFKPVES